VVSFDSIARFRLKNQHISRVYVDPYLESWKRPVLVATVRSQRTMLELAAHSSGRTPLSSNDEVVEVLPLEAPHPETQRISYERFATFKPSGSPLVDDYTLFNNVLCAVENVHADQRASEVPPHISCGYDDPRNSYFIFAFGFRGNITPEDLGRILSASPQRINLLGYDFQMVSPHEKERGALVVEISGDASASASFSVVLKKRPREQQQHQRKQQRRESIAS
jgi:hypothetical protein